MMQATASKSALLLECSWAFERDLPDDEPGEAARYGSAFHSLEATLLMGGKPRWSDVAKRWGVADGVELSDHVGAAHDVLTAWLDGDNEFKHTFEGTRYVELPLALTPLEGARRIAPCNEDHVYQTEPGEMAGTVDLCIIGSDILVLDHKTGASEDYSNVLDYPQLLTLAAAVMRWVGASKCVVAVLHAPRRGMPKVYADRVSLRELAPHEDRLNAALGRIGDGSMRPGAWCSSLYCPASSVCPARDSELLSRAGDVLTGLTAAGGALSAQGLAANDVAVIKAPPGGSLTPARKLGLLYDVVRKSEALAARSRVELRAAIEAGALVETSEGVLTLKESQRESLSKASVVEAYGKLEGARVLDKLRQDGAVKVSQVKSLHVEKERGR